MKPITDRDLDEWAGPDKDDRAKVAGGAGGGFTGIALPDWVSGGGMITPTKARAFAAELILAADLHDAISDQAVKEFDGARIAGSPVRGIVEFLRHSEGPNAKWWELAAEEIERRWS